MSRTMPDGANPKLWAKFVDYADHNGIGEHPDDWAPWWDCFLAGSWACPEDHP